MALSTWLKECSSLLRTPFQRRSARRTPGSRFRQQAPVAMWRQVRSFSEQLEQRVLPATLAWVGDVSQNWSSVADTNTNWVSDGVDRLPADGDTLTFGAAGQGSRTLINDAVDVHSYSLAFADSGYVISGSGVILDNPGPDITHGIGTTRIQNPLTVTSDTEIVVSSGSLELSGSLNEIGDAVAAGLTVSGDGVLILSGTANYSGTTEVSSGALVLEGTLSGTGNVDIQTAATLGGSGSSGRTVLLAGLLSPGPLLPVATAGHLTTAGLSMQAGSTLAIQIEGAAADRYDRLTVTGTADLNGQLSVEFLNGYVPAPGTVFEVLTAGNVIGQFTQWSGLSYANGVLLPIQSPSGLVLVATTFPTGAVATVLNSADDATALLNFFKGDTTTATVTGRIQVAGQNLDGAFSFSRRAATGTEQALTVISASNVTLQLNGASGNLVSVTNGNGVLLLSADGLAAELTASVSEQIADLDLLTPDFGLTINTASTAVNETVMVGGIPRTISLPAGPWVRLTASDAVLSTSVVQVRGNLTLETSGAGATREILFGATDVSALLGDDQGSPADLTDDVGVRLSSGTLLAFVTASGKLALNASGSVGLDGIADLSMMGTASLEINTTGVNVTRTLNVGGVNRTLAVDANTERMLLQNTTLSLGQMVDINGNVSVEATGVSPNRRLMLAATDVSGFVGTGKETVTASDDIGVQFSGSLVALIHSNGTYALQASGAAALMGVTGMDLTGTLAAEKNTTGAAVNEQITVGGHSQTLNLPADVSRVAGSVTLNAENALYLTGTIGVEKKAATLTLADGTSVATTAIQLGGSGLSGFAGLNAAPGSSDQTGVGLSNVSFGYTLATPSNPQSGTDLRTWSALQASVDSATLIGVDVVIASVSGLTVNLNRAGGTKNGIAATVTADFETSPLTNTVGGQSSTLNFKGDLLRAFALIEFEVSGFASIRGRFGIEFGGMDVQLPQFPGVDLPTDFIRFWGIDVDASVGINGPSWSGPDFTGFDLRGVDFNLLLNKRNPLSGVLPEVGAMKWFTLEAAIPEISFAPFLDLLVPDLDTNVPTLSLNRTFDVPAGLSPIPYIDYSVSLPTVTLPALPAMPNFPGLPDLPAVPAVVGFSFDVPAVERMQIDNLPSLNLFNFLSLIGSLTVKRVEYTATLQDGSTVDTWALVLNSVDGGFFAGVNGSSSSSDATGVSVSGVDGAMVVLIPKDLADKRRWVAATGSGNNAALVGLSDLTLSVSDIDIELNRPLGTADGGGSNTSIVNFAATPLHVLMDDGSTVSITHPASSGALLRVSTDATIGVADFLRLSGSFAIQSADRTVKLSDGSTVDGTVLTIAGANAVGFVGVNGGTANAAGLDLTGANFGLAIATDKLDPARRWITTQATVSSVAVLGIPDVTISGSNLAVRINRTDLDGVVADYSVTPLNIPLSGGSSYSININGAGGALLEASGTLTVSVSDFFNVTGAFALRRAAANITLADGSTKDVSLLTLGADGATAFVGLNAGMDQQAGLNVTNADAAIAIVSDLTDPTKRWTAVEASLDGISVTGLSDLSITANNISVEINRASDAQAVVDWAAAPLVVATGPTSSITLNMAGTDGTLLRASGDLTIMAGGFFSVTGALAIEKKTDTVRLHGASTDVPVDLLTIGAASLSAFVGVNGGTAHAKGLALTGVEFGLAIASKRSDRSKRYSALKASATGASVTGLAGLTLSSSNLSVAINRADSAGVVMDLADDNLDVISGPGRTVTLDFDSSAGQLIEASGTMNIGVDSFFTLSGDFALRRGTDTLKDSTGTDVTVDLLTIGAEKVTAFAGLNSGTSNTVGLSLANAGFALAVATSQTDSTKTWIALTADAGSAGFVGPDNIGLTASGVSIAVNRPASDGSLINFSADPLVIATGPSTTRTLSFNSSDGALTEASGHLNITLSNFVQFSGNLALRKSTATLQLATGTDVTTELLVIGGTDLSAFAGINGGTPEAMGFNLSGLNFAFAAATDVNDRSRIWTALDASAAGVAFNGIPGVSISATALDLAVNHPAVDGSLINFAVQPLTVKTGASTSRVLDLSGANGALLEASGTLNIDVAGFFRASGSLGVRKSEFDLALSDSSTATHRVNLLTVAADNLSGFAGMSAASAERAGLELSNLSFALALASDKADPDRRWTTLQATAGAIAPTGISGVTMSSSNLAVTINRKANDDTLANYSRTPLSLSTGSGTQTLNLDSSSGPLVEASGTINISVQDFFAVNGGFAVRSARDTVTLSNGTTVDANLLTIGGSNVSAFAGLNGGSATQTGISLGNADFGLALITDRADSTRKFTSLQATAGLAAFVGADTINITGTDLSVAINRGLHNNFPAIPGASANSQYRLMIADQTRGIVTFTKDSATASANILADDSDAQVAAKVRTALEGISEIGSGNVTVTGSRSVGFTIEFINALARTNVTGLTVSTNATLSGALAATQSAASVTGVSSVQSITLTRLPVERPTITTNVSEVVAGFSGTGQITAIRISASATAAGHYTLTYNGQSRSIRWAQNNVDMNAVRIGDALRDLTGDTQTSVWFDQKSFITSQRFFVKFKSAPGTITGSTSTLSGTVTIENARDGAGAVNEQQSVTLKVGGATGTFQVSVPFNGRTYTTTSLPLTASAGDLEVALNTTLSSVSGSVSVAKSLSGTDVTYNLTYSGSLAGKNLDNAQVTVLADAPTSSGSFTLSYDGVTTAAINLSSNTSTQAAEIQSALQALSSIGNNNIAVVYDATSAAIAPRFLATFTGSLASRPVQRITASGDSLQYATVTPRVVTEGRSALGETQTVTLTKPTSTGTFTLSLSYGGATYTTAPLAFDATVAEVEAGLNSALSSLSGATAIVNDFNGTELSITFAGTLAGTDLADLTGSVTGTVTPAGLTQTTEGFDRPEVPAVNETVVIDYAADPLTIPSGPSSTFTFTMDGQLGELTEASGYVSGTVASFANLSGNFYFRRTLKEGVARLVAGATGVTAFVGNGFETADAKGFQISNGKLGLVVLEKTASDAASYALLASGSTGLTGLSDFTLDGNLTLELQRFNAVIDETIPVGSDSIRVKFDSATELTRLSGTVTLGTPIADLSGSFAVESTGTSPNRRILLAASDVTGFVGDKKGTATTVDDAGVQFSNGSLLAVINANGTYGLSATGSASLVGVSGLSLTGTLTGERNTTGAAISEDLTVGGVTRSLALARDVSKVDGSVTLNAENTLYLTGTVGIEKKTTTLTLLDGSTVDATAIQLGGSGLSGFAGLNAAPGSSDQTGLSVSDVSFGYTLATPVDSKSGTDKRTWSGLKATLGNTSLVGVDVVTASVSSGT
ncbi:MAG: hypothetical protein RLZZ232_975, partial [Planctomycetota bacterium]